MEVSQYPHHAGRGPHPKYGLPLSGQPKTVDGVVFRPYRRGVSLYSRVSDDFRIEVLNSYSRSTYTVLVDGVSLPTRFRLESTAFAAGVKAAKAAPAVLEKRANG